MFINCPHCNALVATDPATDRAPPYCPICTAAIEQAPSVTASAADDRTAMRDDASRRLEQMLSSLEHDADAAANDAAAASVPSPSADVATATRDAGEQAAERGLDGGSAPDPITRDGRDVTADNHHDDAGDARIGRVRVRPPGPAPIDVIRAPVDALPEVGLSLPAAAEMLEPPRSTGIAGFLRRLSGTRGVTREVTAADGDVDVDASTHADGDAAATATAPVTHVTGSAGDAPAAGPTASPRSSTADQQPAAASAGDGAGHADASTAEDTPITTAEFTESRVVAGGATPVDMRRATHHDTDADTPDGGRDGDTQDAGQPPLRPAIARPVDRPRIDLADDPAPVTATIGIDAPPVAAGVPDAPLVVALPIGVAAARSAPSFVRRAPRARARFGIASAAAIAVLSITLVLQLLLADRARLAADARWRQAIVSLCGVLGCSLPPWREPAALALLDRDVRPDPARPGVLRVTATFRNDARWPQPWPMLALTLSDVDGDTLATRDFSAREYLGAAPAQDTLAPGQGASIAMDVVEPDARSVAFDFRLH